MPDLLAVIDFKLAVQVMLGAGVIFTIWAWFQLGKMRYRWLYRAVIVLFTLTNGGLLIWFWKVSHEHIPLPVLCFVAVWHVIILPPTMIVISLLTLNRLGSALSGSGKKPEKAEGISRRDLLSAGLVAVPPLACGYFTGDALYHLQNYRVRRMDVALPNLPRELDGTTIAHITDMHIGKFGREELLENMVEGTNALGVDIVAVTGDIMDFHLDMLPVTVDAIASLRARQGVYVVEGNHDYYADHKRFVRDMRDGGIALLRNDVVELPINGRKLQMVGMTWDVDREHNPDPHTPNVAKLAERVDPDAPSIMLAHHPHVFDASAEAGFDLTLSGHTHGGQLNITREIGVGAAVFRYVSGLYEKGDSRLVVSNGIGNWFPLRIGAPAEIVHITLKSGANA